MNVSYEDCEKILGDSFGSIDNVPDDLPRYLFNVFRHITAMPKRDYEVLANALRNAYWDGMESCM